MSEQTIIDERLDNQAEDAPIAEGVQSPQADGVVGETPGAEATDAVEAVQQELPTAEVEAAESNADAEAEEAASTAEERKKRRRRRRRRSRVALAEPVEIKVIPPKKIVKPLKRGMELKGTVRRIADFGAFVDIGVGTDGLVHISEISVEHVNKVSDVLQEGQEVTVWIKDLDKANNRISLTMIPPDAKTIRNLEEGEILRGTVTRLVPYGAFVDIGVGREAMLHVREMGYRFVEKPEDVVKVGDEIDVRVISIDRRRQRIDVSIKGLRPEPEPEPEPELEPEVYAEDDDEIPSVMAWALQQALGGDFKPRSRRDRKAKRKRRDRYDYDDELEEIYSRTLSDRD